MDNEKKEKRLDRVKASSKKAGNKVYNVGKRVIGARPDGSISGTKVVGTTAIGLGGIGLGRAIIQGDFIEGALSIITMIVGAALRFFNPIDREVELEEPTEIPEITVEDAVAAGALFTSEITYDQPFIAVMKQGHLELGYPEDQFSNLFSQHRNETLKGQNKKHWELLTRLATKSLAEVS